MFTSNASMMLNEARNAARMIQQGGTILYPTDTIWGIGADATSDTAVEKVYRIKRRPDHKSMLVLVSDVEMLSRFLMKMPDNLDSILKNRVKPTTIIYPGARNLATGLLGEDGSVGIRMTKDSFCLKLLEFTGLPIVSTSANLSGEPAPSAYREIGPGIRDQVDLVVRYRQDDINPSAPSTILKLDEKGTIIVLRP